MCGPHHRSAPLLSHTLRRIPQAVGVVATTGCHSSLTHIINVSIPQAVDIVATTFVCSNGSTKSFLFQYRKR